MFINCNQENPENIQQISNIFRQVCIWVDGFTTPSMGDLRRMIYQHGGTMVKQIEKIVCSIVQYQC